MQMAFDQLDGAGSFKEPLGQTKVMQIRQRETQNHQGAKTHEICCLSRQLFNQTAAGSLRFEVTSLLFFFKFAFTYDNKIKSQTLFTISLTKRSFSDGSLIEISSVEFELLDSSSDATQLNCSKIFCRKLLQAQIAKRTKVQTIEAIVEM